MADLNSKEVERANSVFSIYEDPVTGEVDAYLLGHLLRALGLNPSLELIEKLGGTRKRGEKSLSLDKFLPIYSDARKDKDKGVYEDFIECLKLYDKARSGLMLGEELTNVLQNLGEKLSDGETSEVVKHCMDEEDDDGFIPYIPFLARMCEQPVPLSYKP